MNRFLHLPFRTITTTATRSLQTESAALKQSEKLGLQDFLKRIGRQCHEYSDKIKSIALPAHEFLEEKAVQLLAEIQAGLYAEAKARLDGNIKTGVTDWKGVEDYYAGSDDDFKGWLKVSWSKPTGAELDAVDTKLKALKLTIRNAPLQQPAEFAPCLFTGKPGVQEILIGRSY